MIITDFRRGFSRSYNTISNFVKPTVYANTGSAIYNEVDSDRKFATILSKTAFINQLEDTMLSCPGQVTEDLQAILPRLEINKSSDVYIDETITSLEVPHRIASAWFLKHSKMTNGENFNVILQEKIKNVGIHSAVAYWDPNSLIHGYMFTMLENVNPNYSKATGCIEGEITAFDIVKVKNAGVANDPISPKSKFTVNGRELEKASTEVTGNIVISDSVLVKSNNIRLTLKLNYNRINKLPVAPEVRAYLLELANLQVARLLNDEIDVRVHTVLEPVDGEYDKYDADAIIERLGKAANICFEKDLMNPEVVTSFDAHVSASKVKKK